MTQTVGYLLPIRASRHDVLHITQEVQPHWDSKVITIEHALGLTQTLSRTIEAEIEDELDIISSVPTRIADTITITDYVVYGKQMDLSDSIGLVQTVTKTAIFIRSIANTISMADRFTYRPTLKPCDLKTYTPFYGSSSEGVQLPKRYPGGNRTGETIFMVVGETSNYITLKQPRFDDQIRVSRDRIKRELLNGELKVYSDPTWPILNTLTFTLPIIETVKAEEFLAFVQENLGRELYLIDWYGRSWSGLIINPDSIITENQPGRWGINVEFRGKLNNVTPFQDNLELEDLVEVEIS